MPQKPMYLNETDTLTATVLRYILKLAAYPLLLSFVLFEHNIVMSCMVRQCMRAHYSIKTFIYLC